jgi:3-hydroxyacyl-CoA dehydrogenase/enoyl-CoA hydratase/3-hydroxybutyryl-CoA epimerase
MSMVGEGVPAASVEQAALQAGYPVGPLALVDEVSLTLNRRIRHETAEALRASGREVPQHPAEAVVDRMLDEHGRGGRAAGGGFYEYDPATGAKLRLWPGLVEAFGSHPEAIPFEDMKERMLFAEALDAARCLEEGVLRTVVDANVGSLLGIGYPAWTGGVLQYINTYPGGPAGFVARAAELAERYGDRFTAPASLIARAEKGEVYR